MSPPRPPPPLPPKDKPKSPSPSPAPLAPHVPTASTTPKPHPPSTPSNAGPHEQPKGKPVHPAPPPPSVPSQTPTPPPLASPADSRGHVIRENLGPGGLVKGFFGDLKKRRSLKKKKSDSSSTVKTSSAVGGDDDPNPPSPSSPVEGKGALPAEIPKTPPTAARPATMSEEDDPFHRSLVAAQRRVDILDNTTMVLKGVAAVLAAGTAWMPGVGEAVSVVAGMLEAAAKISVGRVTALRLVERSAAVLEAVEQAVIDNKGVLSPVIQKNINQLLSNLHDTNRLLVKLSERPFLKLYLHSDETTRQLAYANESLEDFVRIFQLQTQIAIASWAEQTRCDEEIDMKMLITKLFDSLQSDQKMLETLSIQSESQQEAIKTLQRTLDQMLTLQQMEYNQHHPSSPVVSATAHEALPPPVVFSRFVRMPQNDRKLSIDSIDTGISGLSVQAQRSSTSQSDIGGDIPLPRGATRRSSPSEDEDGLHRQFFEKALDVLRRVSTSTQAEVPDWTITNLEISHGEQISHDERLNSGYFSTIWRGRWQGRDVAIKELTPMADRKLFVKEVEVWRRLRSEYILPFFGASSTTGPPPWFLVSPYMKNGNVLAYLASDHGKQANKLALIHDIAQGMEYLHSRDILHGDFKATNVLVNDSDRAVICDFGLSAMKMDYTTRSQEAANASSGVAGTMRWQSPERLAGGALTSKNDVYAFGMTMYEIVSGQVPYGHIDDSQVRSNVFAGIHPPRPGGVPDRLWNLMIRCWDRDPAKRPDFEHIVQDMGAMYSPVSRKSTMHSVSTDTSSSSYTTASEGGLQEQYQAISPVSSTIPLPDLNDDWSSSSSSIKSVPTHLESQPSLESDRSERQYRHYLQHSFDDRLTLPLWFPSAISLGAVGYIRHGMFVQLLDSHQPPIGKDLPPVPYLDEFSCLQTFESTVNARCAADKALDAMAAITNFIRPSGETSQKAIIRRVPYPLRPGMKQAALLVEDGHVEIYKSLAEARSYLSANIDWILLHYGEQHHIAKEDVIIVVGSLTAHNYAMMLSSFAPRTSLTFNIHASSSRSQSEPWGTWTMEREPPVDPSRAFRLGSSGGASGGAVEHKPTGKSTTMLDEQEFKYSCKVSRVSASPAEAVLLAKLRFAPGSAEPTLYA